MDFLKTPLSSAPPRSGSPGPRYNPVHGLHHHLFPGGEIEAGGSSHPAQGLAASQQWAWAAWPLGVLLPTEVLLISDARRSQASPGPNTRASILPPTVGLSPGWPEQGDPESLVVSYFVPTVRKPPHPPFNDLRHI